MQEINKAIKNLVTDELKSFITFLIKDEVISGDINVEELLMSYKSSETEESSDEDKPKEDKEADEEKPKRKTKKNKKETESSDEEKPKRKTKKNKKEAENSDEEKPKQNKYEKVVINEINEIKVIDYTDKSIIVIGNTEDVKDLLKKEGGRFNAKLTFNNEKVCGWVFKKTKLEEINSLLLDI
jgi:DNA mismatch repair ATPase MutL